MYSLQKEIKKLKENNASIQSVRENLSPKWYKEQRVCE
jgi:hypothetical protein